MKKVTAFETKDGSLFTDLNQAHDYQIAQSVINKFCETMPTHSAAHAAEIIVQHKDFLLALLKKPSV